MDSPASLHNPSQENGSLHDLVTVLSNVEAKKRFEFLEAVSGSMDAHRRYFKQDYELLRQMEPYINQVPLESLKEHLLRRHLPRS